MGRVKGRQDEIRLTVYLLTCIIPILGMPIHFLNLAGLPDSFLITISATLWVTAIISLILFLTRVVSLVHSFTVYGILAELMESIGLVYIAVTLPPHHVIGFFSNIISMMTVLLLLCMGMLRYSALVAAIIGTTAAIISTVIHPFNSYIQMTCLLGVIEFSCIAYSLSLIKMLKQNDEETQEYKTQLSSILDFFNISLHEMSILIQLCSGKTNDEENLNMSHQLSFQTKYNLIEIGNQLKNRQLGQKSDIQALFPNLSASEQEVCYYILLGRTLKDISQLTDKSVSNVSTVRGNIRRKLSLQPSDDLRAYLVNVIQNSLNSATKCIVCC